MVLDILILDILILDTYILLVQTLTVLVVSFCHVSYDMIGRLRRWLFGRRKLWWWITQWSFRKLLKWKIVSKSVILVHNTQATTNSQNQVDSITSGESRNIAPLDVIIVGGGLSGIIVA